MRRISALLFALIPFALPAVTHATVLFSDTFSYPDGPLLGATGSPWIYASGRPDHSLLISNSAATLTDANPEDLGAALSGGPYSAGTLYAGFDITFSALPSATGYLFSQFTNTPTGLSYRTRLWAQTQNAADGKFRLGLSDASSVSTSVTQLPIDLSLGTTYHIVESLDTATGRSTVYLNPTTETGGLSATDPTSSVAIGAFRLTQNTGEGTLSLDNLTVATSFAEVVPEPATLALVAFPCLTLTRRR